MLEFVGQLIAEMIGELVVGGLRGGRAGRGPIADLARKHPKSVVRSAELVSWPGLTRVGAAEVGAAIVDETGISFRDRYDFELLPIPADDIASLEVVEDAGEFIRVTRRSGQPVDFWVNGRHGVQATARNQLARALGMA